MSVVYFELGAPDGLRSRFLADAADFAAWLDQLAEEFPGQYPPSLTDRLADIVLRGAEALVVGDPGEARQIDRLVHDYWNFCTMTGCHGEKDITPAAYELHRYATELSHVLPTATEEMCNYYRRLFAGNSLAECDGHAYSPEDGVFRWSWLLPQEVVDFYNKLSDFAGLLDGEEEGAAGVRCVLTALRRAKEERSSLLISVA